MKAYIQKQKCVGCGGCIINCPRKAIHMLPGWHAEVDPSRCIGCGKCVEICHRGAPTLIESNSENA